MAIDALDIDAVRPFWQAVLDYVEEPTPPGARRTPSPTPAIGPPIWFQQMDEPRPQRNRIHIDVTVPHDVADVWVAAGMAAGGTAGHRPVGPGVLDARRPRGQRGVHLHVAGPWLSERSGAELAMTSGRDGVDTGDSDEQEMLCPCAEPAVIPQGSLELLDTPVARKLLASAMPARVAYTAKDGTPRIVSTWFRWTNGELVMPTYIQGHRTSPPRGAALRLLRARPDVAISIDTDTEPPQVLLVRGKAHMSEVDGVDPDYAASARHYLGEDAAREPPRHGRPAGHPHGPDHGPSRLGRPPGLRGGRLPGVIAVPEA